MVVNFCWICSIMKTHNIYCVPAEILYLGKFLFLRYMIFSISNFSIGNNRLKLAKNQEKAKQHPEAELLLYENYSVSSSVLLSETNIRYSKKCTKTSASCFNEIIWLIIMKLRLKMKNRSHKYSTNRTRSRHGQKCTKHKMYLITMMAMCYKPDKKESVGQNTLSQWLFASWYKFTKIKNWSKIFWLRMIKNRCDQSGLWNSKLTVSQEWTDGINWFFACWYKFMKA